MEHITELAPLPNLSPAAVLRLPLPIPWRDPQSVPKDLLRQHITHLEQRCDAQPESADLLTCLAMAYAMDLRVEDAQRTLEKAKQAAPAHFWAQFKIAELQYRARALAVAEREMLRALDLASSESEYSLTRGYLKEIRTAMRDNAKKPLWSGDLRGPALVAAVLFTVVLLAGTYLR